MLLSACRQALVCIEDNEVNDIAKSLQYILSSPALVSIEHATQATVLLKQLSTIIHEVEIRLVYSFDSAFRTYMYLHKPKKYAT